MILFGCCCSHPLCDARDAGAAPLQRHLLYNPHSSFSPLISLRFIFVTNYSFRSLKKGSRSFKSYISGSRCSPCCIRSLSHHITHTHTPYNTETISLSPDAAAVINKRTLGFMNAIRKMSLTMFSYLILRRHHIIAHVNFFLLRSGQQTFFTAPTEWQLLHHLKACKCLFMTIFSFFSLWISIGIMSRNLL